MNRLIGRLKTIPAAFWVVAAVLTAAVGGVYWASDALQTSGASAERKVLYYKNPMGTGHVSDKPMKDEMGMDYVAVYADERDSSGQDDASVVRIGPAVIQNAGVRTAQVAEGPVTSEIEANGVLAVDESTTTTVTMKFDGYIEKLHVTAVGQTVKVDDPLFDVYSPDLDARLQEYLAALRYQDSIPAHVSQTVHRNATDLVVMAHMRLESLGIRKAQLKKMASESGVPRVVTFHSSQSGTVLKKNALEGGSFTAGTELFVLSNLSTLWVLADVYTQDYAVLRVGSRARVDVQGIPGKTFEGRVDFIYPTVDAQTRVAKLRIVLPNPQRLLRPDMFARVTIQGQEQTRLVVPKPAVLRDGKRNWVIVSLGEGRFRPQEVKLGGESGEYYAVLSGLKEGETVVTSAQFLLDSESRLQEALHKLTSESREK